MVLSLPPAVLTRTYLCSLAVVRGLSRVLQVYTVPFLQKGKPVFNVEYSKDYGVCFDSIALGIDTIFKVRENSAKLGARCVSLRGQRSRDAPQGTRLGGGW